jgi:hypothetical protein
VVQVQDQVVLFVAIILGAGDTVVDDPLYLAAPGLVRARATYIADLVTVAEDAVVAECVAALALQGIFARLLELNAIAAVLPINAEAPKSGTVSLCACLIVEATALVEIPGVKKAPGQSQYEDRHGGHNRKVSHHPWR